VSEAEPREAPADRAPASGGRRGGRVVALLSLLGLAVVAFGTGLILFNNLVMPRLIHGVGDVQVPDLSSLTVEQAERTLRPLGLQLSRAGERFDPSVPRGFILSQDPPPDVPVRGRRRVLVVVSLGEEFSSVPALFGESVRGAQLLLDRAGLRPGGTTRVPSEDVGEGLVIGSDPPAETVLPREAPVSLLVSTGPGEEFYVMPDLIGREISGARHQLETFGLRVLTPPAAPSVGSIVFQQPVAGSRITRDVTIALQATGRVLR
jgi:serine/threonine-protein kinase